MKLALPLMLLLLVSCATVVNNGNFETPEQLTAPEYKKSISLTVFVKLYDEEGEFYGYGYNPDLTNQFVSTFKASNAFTQVTSLDSICSESYTCLDIPTSKKISMQRHVNIILPSIYAPKDFSTISKVLSLITLGIFPAYYKFEETWEVSMYNNKREQIYSDDTTYEGKTLSAIWLHYRDDKLTSNPKDHYDEFYSRISKQILKNIIFQLKRFP